MTSLTNPSFRSIDSHEFANVRPPSNKSWKHLLRIAASRLATDNKSATIVKNRSAIKMMNVGICGITVRAIQSELVRDKGWI